MTTLTELIARCEQAEDFDRELDRDIGQALLGWKVTDAYIETDEPAVYPNHPGAMYPSFTESLETAMSLAIRLLDNGSIDIEVAHRSVGGKAYGRAEICGPDVDESAIGPTPAIALCICILSALRAKEGTKP